LQALEILKYIGPGFIVTVGFIDPGNWASNVAAGASYGYSLLWVVSLSTVMLLLLQHNVAHLGIVTGLCLSEAATKHTPRWVSRAVLATAMVAAISTALAELLGAAIGLHMLFGVNLRIGLALTLIFVLWMLLSNSYRRLERIIIGFVGLIGLAFLFELTRVHVEWGTTAVALVVPQTPMGSMPIVMSVLGAVVMPHNLFLHSEIIQSRQWQLEDEALIKRQLSYEFTDTLAAMVVGWAINAAMIIVAAATFFAHHVQVDQIEQAKTMLEPLLGPAAAVVFALALLFSGLSSSVTAGMASGSIFAGIFGEPYDARDRHTRWGILIALFGATIVALIVPDTFKALIISQIALSVQLPITIFLQIALTSSGKVMGKWANGRATKVLLWIVGIVVTGLNVMLVKAMVTGG
jgi:manganese transport protein